MALTNFGRQSTFECVFWTLLQAASLHKIIADTRESFESSHENFLPALFRSWSLRVDKSVSDYKSHDRWRVLEALVLRLSLKTRLIEKSEVGWQKDRLSCGWT